MDSLTHVDDWLDTPPKDEAERKAKEWLEHFRRPAIKQDRSWLEAHPLFCLYGGKRYRVTGCSRLGDVWLSTNLNRLYGYDLRVDVMHCFDWSGVPESA